MTIHASFNRLCVLSVLTSVACDVPAPPPTTGGVPDIAQAEPSSCGRGFSVLETDYESINVALVGLDGHVLTESLATSRVVSQGAATSLSGDVVPASSIASGPELPLIDRSGPTPRVIWIDLSTGATSRTLAVDTGFPANPHDFALSSQTKAYVSRFGHNRDAGKQPFDEGSDLLIVNPKASTVIGSIDLHSALEDDSGANLPRPENVIIVGQYAYVLLGTLPLNGFAATASSRLVMIDIETDSIRETLVLDGLRGCQSIALAPNEKEIAVLCSALSNSNGDSEEQYSGIAIVSLTPEPKLLRHLPSSLWGGAPTGSSGAYLAQGSLLVTTYGRYSATGKAQAQDSLVKLSLSDDRVESILDSNGTPFTLGGLACAPDCHVCVLADAGRNGGVIHHYEFDSNDEIATHAAVKVESRVGLPPRYIGRF